MNTAINVIEPSGILDSILATQIRQEISTCVKEGSKVVLIDLQQVTFIDSSGLAGLAMAMKSLRSVGGRLCFCSVGEQPRMLFELTGMEAVFEFFSDRDEFEQTIA
ncbi:STAS domain-containing protein [Kovacikia minuta CCNUW1]|uniref:STAS domain-containing protein n=1 Tax=Kovacikia minuta TaxID=2931930 RepID=UPI001CCE70E2|nr:STAS domain-containing protein [Kovacikia minuta]UBF25768.1 STAS domain-containing protein [Kovacikia minuta CCNUW1]